MASNHTLSSDFGEVYAGRRVFITGHTGFKGSWLTLWLLQLGAKVSAFALPPMRSSPLFDELHLGDCIAHSLGDLRSNNLIENALKRAKPEILFHLAAQPLVRHSYADPMETFQVNALGTARVLDAARRHPSIRAIVVVTTDKVYADPENPHARSERDPLGGRDPYSASKACAEIIATSYGESYFENAGVATARAGNVIGGGDWAADRVIPDMMRAFSTGGVAAIRNPKSIRPWQHVLEPLSGYLSLGAHLFHYPKRFAGAWNFGPRESDVTVEQVANLAASVWGYGARWRKTPRKNAPHEAASLRLNAAKARRRLKWRPIWDFRKAVNNTVAWYRAAQSRSFDARSFTISQIDAYRRDAYQAKANWVKEKP